MAQNEQSEDRTVEQDRVQKHDQPMDKASKEAAPQELKSDEGEQPELLEQLQALRAGELTDREQDARMQDAGPATLEKLRNGLASEPVQKRDQRMWTDEAGVLNKELLPEATRSGQDRDQEIPEYLRMHEEVLNGANPQEITLKYQQAAKAAASENKNAK